MPDSNQMFGKSSGDTPGFLFLFIYFYIKARDFPEKKNRRN